jgi:ribosomal protein S18 acetylase RimI-like enzyme
VEKWVECYNESFIDHWNFQPMTVAERRHDMTSVAYRPDLDLVLETADGTFAAFCLGRIDPDEHAAHGGQGGWIAQLGTRRGYRGQGLGRAMLLAGLRTLRAAGVDTAALRVDAENPTGALRLYESVGFTAVDTDIAHCKDL